MGGEAGRKTGEVFLCFLHAVTWYRVAGKQDTPQALGSEGSLGQTLQLTEDEDSNSEEAIQRNNCDPRKRRVPEELTNVFRGI
jgi:hypothetical protein